MRRSIPLLLTCALLAAGCERPRDTQADRTLATRALRGVLAYPQSSLVSISAGNEAAELAFSSPDSVSNVATWYRQVLLLNGWDVRSDVTQKDGSVRIYAQKDTQPLWVAMRPSVGGPGSTYTLVGAVPRADSTKQDSIRR
jgi:hypothetical protein